MERELSAYQIIQKKRDGHPLNPEEIKFFIQGLLSGQIADYQMTALLMAIYLEGMNKVETAALTDAMLYSGKVLNFEQTNIIDKHSTGGVGDKASFVLAPIAAACDVMVPMIAGRGLGHTGGTVDKIESVPGFKTNLNLNQFQKQLIKEGLVLIGQTQEIAPADKMIYALRDVTATVESIPLITASIMSKKLAEGANGIVMDIKTGKGAFMQKKSQARALARSLIDTGYRFNKNMFAMITDMNQPLGNKIGNSLEIIESIETLKGRGPKDLTDLSLQLAGAMIYLAGKAKSHKGGVKLAREALKSGKALEKFRHLLLIQGGNVDVVDDYTLLPQAKYSTEVLAFREGYVSSIDCKQMGHHLVSLGGGRHKVSDKIDFSVGLDLKKKIGQKVSKGESLCTIHYNEGQQTLVDTIAEQLTLSDILVRKNKPKPLPLIVETFEKLAR